MRLNYLQTSHALQAFVDSICEQNLKDMDLARQLVFPLVPLKPPILASALNNKVFAYITHKTEPMQLITSSNQWETTPFMFPSPDTALILSFPWLEKHNPHLE